MRLVFVTQKLDADDPILGATVEKVRALAERCEQVHVLALAVGRHDLPANVTFATFGASTRLRRGFRYARVLLPALLPRRPDALIAHMCPIYLVLAAPFAKPLRVPLVVWYTHWTIDRTLRLATWLCDAALSVERQSYPLDSPKVIATGHGIDVDVFAPGAADGRRGGPLRLLGLGRTSPSKGFVTLLTALERANERGLDVELELRGPSTTDEERAHRQELLERIESGPLRGRARLEGPVPYGDVPALLRRFDAVVNPTRGQTHGGALDKVVYEAAATGVPVFACNPHLTPFLTGLHVELHFRSAEPDDLAAKLIAFAATPPDARAELGRELRRRVVTGHSSGTWADAVTRVVTDLRSR